MPVGSTKPRKRLTREESRAQTRAMLIAEGRKHFLLYGLGGAVAEKIAEDAGYSRGVVFQLRWQGGVVPRSDPTGTGASSEFPSFSAQ